MESKGKNVEGHQRCNQVKWHGIFQSCDYFNLTCFISVHQLLTHLSFNVYLHFYMLSPFTYHKSAGEGSRLKKNCFVQQVGLQDCLLEIARVLETWSCLLAGDRPFWRLELLACWRLRVYRLFFMENRVSCTDIRWPIWNNPFLYINQSALWGPQELGVQTELACFWS